jgi:hypothetical protein
MSELRRLKDKLENCYLNGFFLDRNTFLKADDAAVVLVPHKEESAPMVEKPMIILKNVVEMTVAPSGKIVAVGCWPELGVWIDAVEHALIRFNG